MLKKLGSLFHRKAAVATSSRAPFNGDLVQFILAFINRQLPSEELVRNESLLHHPEAERFFDALIEDNSADPKSVAYLVRAKEAFLTARSFSASLDSVTDAVDLTGVPTRLMQAAAAFVIERESLKQNDPEGSEDAYFALAGKWVTFLSDATFPGLPEEAQLNLLLQAIAVVAPLLKGTYGPQLFSDACGLVTQCTTIAPFRFPDVQRQIAMVCLESSLNLENNQFVFATMYYVAGVCELQPTDVKETMLLLMGICAGGSQGIRPLPILELGLTALRALVDLAPANARAAVIFAETLSKHYYATGSIDDLEEATAALERSLRAHNENAQRDGTSIAQIRNTLGVIYGQRYEAARNPTDIAAMITLLTRALDEKNLSEELRTSIIHNLGGGYHKLYELTSDPKALDNAISLYRQAFKLSNRKGPVSANLASLLQSKYEFGADAAYLEESKRYLEVALGSEPSTMHRARVLQYLANYYRLRFLSSGNLDHYTAAIDAYRAAADSARQLAVFETVPIVATWGDLALSCEDWSNASEAFTIGVEVMLSTVPSNAVQQNKMGTVALFHDFASRGAYALAKLDKVLEACYLMEAGRARLLNEAFELHLSDSQQLKESAPELAEELASVRNELSTGAASFPNRRLAIGRLEHLLGKIRKLPRFAHFSIDLSIDAIREAASDRPLIYLVETHLGSVALILTSAEATTLWLDELQSHDLRKHYEAFLRSYETNAGDWPSDLESLLRWLWDRGIGTLATTLSRFKAVRLIPCGWLTYLPIHAAFGELAGKRIYVRDLVGISYLPNARTLFMLPERVATKPLAIRVSPKASPLPASEREIESVKGTIDAQILQQEDATVENILRALEAPRSLVHFAGHGRSLPNDPLDSYLLLYDNRLRVRQLLDRPKSSLGCVVLSACETARVGHLVPDELIGLPSAFLQIGARQVVASFWRVPDDSTSELMRLYYLALKRRATVSEALDDAVSKVRSDTAFAHPVCWAAFALYGVDESITFQT